MIPYAQSISTVPANGTNAVHRLTIGGSPTTGTFKMTWNGRITSAITWSATNATLLANIQTALDALFGSGNATATAATLTAGIGTIDITFSGSYAKQPMATIMGATNVDLDGNATLAVASQTTGVLASFRGAAPGAMLICTSTTPPRYYVNASNTLYSPSWVLLMGSTANGLTAHAGGGQGSALALTKEINRVTTVGSAADSVVLPAAIAGLRITVINAAAANAMAVFPASGDAINALSANASISVAANKRIDFVCAVAGTWDSNLTA